MPKLGDGVVGRVGRAGAVELKLESCAEQVEHFDWSRRGRTVRVPVSQESASVYLWADPSVACRPGLSCLDSVHGALQERLNSRPDMGRELVPIPETGNHDRWQALRQRIPWHTYGTLLVSGGVLTPFGFSR